MQEGKGTKSLAVALGLLDYFTEERLQLGLSALARLSGLPKANVFRHLLALEEKGYIKQDAATKKYQLGFKPLELAYLVNKQFSLRDVVLPYMKRLKEETNETVCLQVEDSGRGICIERLESNNRLLYLPPLGSREYLHAGASRKVLLAFLPEERIAEIIDAGLPAVTAKTVTDPEQLRRDLKLIREKGYAVTEEEHVEGVSAISAPVRGRDGKVVASLSIVGPAFRFNREKKEKYLEKLLQTVREISRELGYLPAEQRN